MEAFLISTIHDLPFRMQHSDRTVDQQNASQHESIMGENP
jgi:hypothetical protein